MTTFQIRNEAGQYFDGYDFYADQARAKVYFAVENSNGYNSMESKLSMAQFVDQTAYVAPFEDDDEAEDFWTCYNRGA